jgi:hypothetical protein
MSKLAIVDHSFDFYPRLPLPSLPFSTQIKNKTNQPARKKLRSTYIHERESGKRRNPGASSREKENGMRNKASRKVRKDEVSIFTLGNEAIENAGRVTGARGSIRIR